MSKLLLFLIFNLSIANAQNTFYILPAPGFQSDATLFNPDERDDTLKVFCQLRNACTQRGLLCTTYQGQQLDDSDYLLVCELYPSYLPFLKQVPKNQLFLISFEPPTVNPYNYYQAFHEPFSSIFTLLDAVVDHTRYFKFYYPQPSLELTKSTAPWDQKKLCTTIACNKSSQDPRELYSERLAIINFFEQYHPDQFDLYGVGWHHGLKTYKGFVKNKRSVLQQYKFCVCYENSKDLNGYITEKIFDCMTAGCIPIYYGPSNITNYIPDSCFIDRRQFATHEELYDFLISLTQADYDNYLYHIERFLKSPQAQQFSIANFIELLLGVIIKK